MSPKAPGPKLHARKKFQASISNGLVAFLAVLVLLGLGTRAARGQTVKLEAQLLWGTDDKTSPDPKHTPVSPDVRKKLNKDLPLKWSNYFVVNRESFEVEPSRTNKVSLSKSCAIEVKNLGHSTIEVSHFGKGERVWTGKQTLPKGQTLVLGGNAPSSTSWLIVLKRTD